MRFSVLGQEDLDQWQLLSKLYPGKQNETQAEHRSDPPQLWAPVLLQMQHPLQKVRPFQHSPGKGQFLEGLQQLADEADLLVLLGSLQHGCKGGHQIGGCGQLGEGEGAGGAGHSLQLGLPHREAHLLCAVLPHEAHEVGKATCTHLLCCTTSCFHLPHVYKNNVVGTQPQLASLYLTITVIPLLLPLLIILFLLLLLFTATHIHLRGRYTHVGLPVRIRSKLGEHRPQ